MHPQDTKCTPASVLKYILGQFLLGGLDLEVYLDGLWGRRPKKGRQLFWPRKCTPRQNPGYAYGEVKSKKVKKGIAVCRQACHHRYGNNMPYGITQCYLLPGRGDIPAFTSAEAGTRFSDPGGMQGWVDLGGWLEMVYPHPSWTNRARCWLTSLMRPTTLTTTPIRHPEER